MGELREEVEVFKLVGIPANPRPALWRHWDVTCQFRTIADSLGLSVSPPPPRQGLALLGGVGGTR